MNPFPRKLANIYRQLLFPLEEGWECFRLASQLSAEGLRRQFGGAVRARRKEAGLSQETLAEKADLSTVFISRIERGVESPSVDNLLKIAKALGVRVRDLADGF